MACRFPFESEVYESLALIPLGVRRKLDLAGLKLSLQAWSALPREDRLLLRELRVESAHDVDALRGYLFARVSPGLEPREVTLDWRARSVPAEVAARLHVLGVALDEAGWGQLDDEGRWVLVHLARREKDDGRFGAACAVLGLRA